ncbi:hypothetical protein ACQ86B_29155 (plasmid) [Mycolicibacterium aichiense]|uniref:hypothetical protein n=1 Tax=Mycolicibacterium aichiense TaxID=1799 RepID=UPI003D6661F7
MRTLRAIFVDPQTRRDVDLDHWWQLPEDATRTTSVWAQLFVDLVAPATFSQWHERIAERRVQAYDKLRPAAVRTVAFTAISATFIVVGAPLLCWLALMPAVVQIPLEVYLQRFHALDAPDPRWTLIRRMRDLARRHFQTRLLNVTGVIGAVACPLNVIAVCFANPGGSSGWMKIVALAAAIFYLNSGLANVLLDPPNYTESSLMPPFMHAIRPYAPLISLAIVSTIVALSVHFDRWIDPMVAVAYLCAGLTLLIGSTVRNHDRVVAAAAYVGRQAVEAGREALGGDFHDDLGPAKAAADNVAGLPGIAYRDAIELRALSSFLTHFSTRTGLFDAQRMTLSSLAKKVASPYGISPRNITFDIRWDEPRIRKEDHRVSVRMTTALVHNVGQVLQRQFRGYPRMIALEGLVTGDERDRRYQLSVRDHLPLIPEDEWCCEGGTLSALRDWLRDTFDGDLTQEDMGDGTKRITASWSDRPPNRWEEPPAQGVEIR